MNKNWRSAIVWVISATAVIIATYYPTFKSMVDQWLISDTYTHGFLIFPISLWLVWEYRERLVGSIPIPDWRYVGFILLFGLLWYLGELSNVLFVSQFAVVGILVSVIATILGRDLIKVLWFPLLFLFFMVPAGGWLVPPMMEFTATFTVELVRLSGIPVYRDGLNFNLPSGNWAVIQACSGVRYIIASVTLGAVYAYMTYSKWHKQLLFMIAAIALPIVANGIRAYLIVMIGHLSDMELATGVDHLLYGWVFFGIVMAILFYFGARWRDSEEELRQQFVASDRTAPRQLIILPLSFFFAVIWSVFIYFGLGSLQNPYQQLANKTIDGWEMSEQTSSPWSMVIAGDAVVYRNTYTRNGVTIHHVAIAYPSESQGNELINAQHQLIDAELRWKAGQVVVSPISEGEIKVTRIYKYPSSLFAVKLYQIGTSFNDSEMRVKWQQFTNRLLGSENTEALHYFAISNNSISAEQSRDRLVSFVDQYVTSWVK